MQPREALKNLKVVTLICSAISGWQRNHVDRCGNRRNIERGALVCRSRPYVSRARSDRVSAFSNRVYATYEAIVDACCIAWNKLIAAPARIRSIATREYAKTVNSLVAWYKRAVRNYPQQAPFLLNRREVASIRALRSMS